MSAPAPARGAAPGPLGTEDTTDLDRGAGSRSRAEGSGLDLSLAVSTSGLTKRFRGGQVAVDDLGLVVPNGAVYGFLGPNGSGKTTSIRMLLGLIAPTSGQVSLLGQRLGDARASLLPRVGAMVEGPAFHPYLSGRANLRRSDAADRTAHPRTSDARIGAALERVGLAAAADKRFRVYSLGMKQRLGLAAALLRPRDLLVLDEPTNGLDPQGTREVRTLVRELAADGTTVVVSTHLLAEVEQLCSHVGVMSAGRMVAQGTLADVTSATGTTVVVECRGSAAALEVLARAGLSGARVESEGSAVPVVSVDLGAADPEALLAALVSAGAGVRQFTLVRGTLEDLFVSMTGEGFDVRA